jgi:E3 SUMO-protein ligase PIAS1
VDEILHSTSSDIEQVTIEPHGAWHYAKTDDDSQNNNIPTGGADDDDDDDFIEIGHLFTPKLKREDASDSFNLHTTPSTQDRIPSVPKSSQKRPAPQVIDLTISDDEDDEPPRPPKRQALGTGDHPLSLSRGNSLQNGFSENGILGFPSGSESLSPGQSTFYIDV